MRWFAFSMLLENSLKPFEHSLQPIICLVWPDFSAFHSPSHSLHHCTFDIFKFIRPPCMRRCNGALSARSTDNFHTYFSWFFFIIVSFDVGIKEQQKQSKKIHSTHRVNKRSWTVHSVVCSICRIKIERIFHFAGKNAAVADVKWKLKKISTHFA